MASKAFGISRDKGGICRGEGWEGIRMGAERGMRRAGEGIRMGAERVMRKREGKERKL